MSNINIGIDLGTTNSAIAEFVEGKVVLHRNPIDFSELLPSVVSYKNQRIIIGNKAKEKLLTDSKNTFTSFKRKMGSESFFEVDDLMESVSPIQLSSLILKELKGFLIGKEIDAAVITIPASFDTLQSNATKEAGYLAGLNEVVLLQEPVAACIAYSNHQNVVITDEENWLVYDFGGGTFDVSLARVSDRELKIIDHKGNNFLGGVDIDQLIIQNIVCKVIAKENPEHDMLWDKMISKEAMVYTKFYYEILYRVEEVKKELSLREVVYLEIDYPELNINQEIAITRDAFNALILKKFELSYRLLEELLEANTLDFTAISRIILVGGTTYIPFIRSELHRRTGIFVDASIDPTTAVAVGAAYFAGSKPLTSIKKEQDSNANTRKEVHIEWIYENQTNDLEELIVGIFEVPFKGYFRISRSDGGYDTGITSFENKISHFVTLLQKVKNSFTIEIFDTQKNDIQKYTFEISQGLYTILGQPLPNDICIELDGEQHTYLEKIVTKNDVLPLKKVIYKTLSKTILKNSDDKLVINVLEGDVRDAIETNLLIGNILISGHDIPFDMIKGMDVGMTFFISESRDLTIEVAIDSIGYVIKQVFSPSYRNVDLEKVQREIKYYIDKVFEKTKGMDNSNVHYERLLFYRNNLIELYGLAIENTNNTLTDIKFQIDDEKRDIIKKIDAIIGNENLLTIIEGYHTSKRNLEGLESKMNSEHSEHYKTIIKEEKYYLSSGNKNLIIKKTDDLNKLNRTIYKNTDEYYFEIFYTLKHNYNIKNNIINKKHHDEMIMKGEQAMREKNIQELKVLLGNLIANLSLDSKKDAKIADLSNKLGLE